MKIIKAIMAFIDWAFFYHGYDLAGGYERQGAPVVEFKCKQCGRFYKSLKRNDTCSNIKCFIGYRLRR